MGHKNDNRSGRNLAGPVVLALVSLTACFTQRPLETAVPEPATRIVAEVTDMGTVEMGNAIGPGAVGVEGIVAATEGESWSLQLIRVNHRDGTSILWNRELVVFPRSALTNVAVKRLDKVRSWIAAGLVVAAAIAAGRAFGLVGGDEPTDIEPPPPNRIQGGVDAPSVLLEKRE